MPLNREKHIEVPKVITVYHNGISLSRILAAGQMYSYVDKKRISSVKYGVQRRFVCESYQMKSLQIEQNVGCRKNVAMNLCPLT